MKELKRLYEEQKGDNLIKYSSDWQSNAVAELNNYYVEHELYDEEIFDTSSEIWDELVELQLKNRGWVGLLFFLGQINTTTNYAMLDGYGNAIEITGDDIVGAIKDILEEEER